MNLLLKLIFFTQLLFFSLLAFAQETVVRGRITDVNTNEAIPFANVKFKGIATGTSADFDGYYILRTSTKVDSITANYLGYIPRTKKVKARQNQTIDFQLKSSSVGIKEVVVEAGVNPAIQVIKDAQKRRDLNNKSSLPAYQYENYSKIQIDVDNISDKVRSKKILKPVTNLFDSLDVLAGEDGHANLPVFYSENISDVYYTSEPNRKKKEIIKASKLTAVGIQDGILTSQFTGSSFEEYNFNQNKLLIFEKEFLSPISDNSLFFYDFFITDTVYLNNFRCFQIKVRPKNNRDLLFSGFIWITDSTWALKQVNLEIPKSVNINFIERVQVQQELEPTSAGAWLTMRSRVVVDFADISKNTVGMLAKIYNSIKDVKVNEPQDPKFYDAPIRLTKEALTRDTAYWNRYRHEKLTSTDINVFSMIDTIRNIPRVKVAVNTFYTVVSGHYAVNKIDIGPYPNLIAYNNIEGYKFRIGARTNINFSNEWIYRAYIAYGTKDQQFKYNLQVEKILSRVFWTKVGIQRRVDIDQVGLAYQFDDSPAFDNEQSSLYVTTSQITRFALMNKKIENRFWFEREITKNLTTRLTIQNIDYKHFYNASQDSNVNVGAFQRDFTTTEFVFETRLAWNEYQVLDNNRRYIIGNTKLPILTLQYIKGVKGLFNSDLNYDRFNIRINHRLRLGFLGYSRYAINFGKLFSAAPYTLLEVHRGNQTPFFANATFNMMNYFEFISDEYISLDYVHHFEGLFFNRVPLIRQLKWRELVTLRAVYGDLSAKNRTPVITNSFSTLRNKPYVEAGFGVSNIFRIIRVDFIYRLTYTDDAYRLQYRQLQLNNNVTRPYDVDRFGVKVSLLFAF